MRTNCAEIILINYLNLWARPKIERGFVRGFHELILLRLRAARSIMKLLVLVTCNLMLFLKGSISCMPCSFITRYDPEVDCSFNLTPIIMFSWALNYIHYRQWMDKDVFKHITMFLPIEICKKIQICFVFLLGVT